MEEGRTLGFRLEWELLPLEQPFDHLVDVVAGSSGEVYALDAGLGVVVRMHPKGADEGRFGRLGQGPGEFLSAQRVFFLGGEVAVPDVSSRRIVRFLGDGTFVGTTQIPQDRGLPSGWAGSLENGLVVRLRSAAVPIPDGSGGGGEGDVLVAMDLSTGDVEELLTLPTGGGITVKVRPMIHLLAPEPVWHVSRDGWIAMGMNDAYRITLIHRENEVATIELPAPRQAVPTPLKSRLVGLLGDDMLRRGAPPERLAGLEQLVRVGEWIPVIARVMFGPSGTVLVQSTRDSDEILEQDRLELQGLELKGIESPRWAVFDRKGVLTGHAEFHAGFQPTDSDDRLVYGIFNAADGTQTVRAYSLGGIEGGERRR